jgi:hypothetical protein
MQTRSNRRIALLVALALPLSGCSWIFMTKAPEPVAAPNYPVDCTASSAAPILDTICSAYFVVNGIYLLAIPDCASAGFGETCYDSGAKYGGAALSAGLAVLCGISAGAGYPQATRCQQVKDLNALCITGDLGACQRLRPGWTPSAAPPYPGVTPYPGGPPPPPPAQPAPPPAAAPPAPKPGAAAPSIDPAAYQAAVAAAAR